MRKMKCLASALLLSLTTLTINASKQSLDKKLSGQLFIVNQKHPKASDQNPGTKEAPFKTISAGAKVAKAGDTVLVYAGTYRERVTPERSGSSNAPIIYQAAMNENVFIKGSEVFSPQWQAVGENIFEGKLDMSIFKEVNPFHRTISIAGADQSKAARPSDASPLPETLGQVFINGKPYLQVMTQKHLEECPGTWLVNAAGDALLIHFKLKDKAPAKQFVEISTRSRIFQPYRRGLSNIHVKGFIMEHCANQGGFPQNGALSIRSGRNWLIENNTIRYAKTCGLDIGSEYWDGKQLAKSVSTAEADQRLIIGGNNMIRNNIVSDNGLCGIVGWNHNGSKIISNTVERNNRLGFPHGRGWEEWAGIKLHCTNTLIAGNLVRDNEAHGIWIDNGYRNAHITRNVVLNNLQSGIFLELGGGAPSCLVDNNIIGFTRSQGGFYNGNGIYTHDASDITMAHNLFIANAGFGVNMRLVTNRRFGGKKVSVTNEKILNNIFVGNSLGCISLPADSSRSGNNVSDYNYFDIGGGKADFSINKFWATFDWDKLTVKLEDALKRDKVPETKWPNFKGWRYHSVLSFEAWQALMGMDKHSIRVSAHQGKTNIKLHARQPELVFKAGENMLEMRCPKVEDADYDFYGNPIPENSALPGPFQRIGKETVLLPLINMIKNPKIRLTPNQKELKKQRETIETAIKDIKKGNPGQHYDITNKNPEIWFSANQNIKNAGMTQAYSEINIVKHLKANTRSTAKGPSRGLSKVFLFKAPRDGWFDYNIKALLTRRTASTAGYSGAELMLLDGDIKNAISLGKQYANTKGGYKSETYDNKYEFKGEIAMKKDWYLAIRFYVVSPGPAPAGYADVEMKEFSVTAN